MSTFKDIFTCSDEEIYQICKDCDFNRENIMKYCGVYRISFSHVLYRARYYALDSKYQSLLEMPDEELDLFYNESFRKIIRKYQLFIAEVPLSLHSLKESDIKDIWQEIQNNFVYYFEKIGYNKEIIEKKCKEWNIPYQETVDLIARFYINSNRKVAREDMKTIEKKFSHLTDKKMEITYDLYEKLLKAKTREEIIELAESSIQLFRSSSFSDFATIHHNNELEEVTANLKSKLAIYNDYKKQLQEDKMKQKAIQTKNAQIKLGREIVSGFITSDFQTVKDYCRENGFSLKKFQYYLKILQDNQDSCYEEYQKKLLFIKSQKHEQCMKVADVILDKIDHGVVVNGEYKEFDLVDYYLITKIPPKVLFQEIKGERDVETIKKFARFYTSYATDKMLNERTLNILLESREVLGVQMDSSGEMIPNSGKEIKLEEKYQILDFLSQNNIPLTYDVYRICLHRIANSTLIKEEDHQNTYRKGSF